MTYIGGLDLGQTSDPTALAILEQTVDSETSYLVRHLERYPLGTPYTAIVEKVKALFSRPPLPESMLAVDQTGVGRPVVDMFRQAGMQAWLRPITITGGTNVQEVREEFGFHVPKKELVSTLQVLLQFRRLKIASGLPEAKTLVKELQNFRVKITAAANETFGAWRDGQHDDLVLAVAMAAWLGERSGGWTGEMESSETLITQAGVFAEGRF